MARVYVGTYGKYNDGNLDGSWVDLAKFSTYDEFLRHCGAIHRNERDPEFMIQDFEDLPDGLSCGEWISRKDFDDIKAAMAEETKEQERTKASAPAVKIIDYSEKALAVTGETRTYADSFKAMGGKFNARLSCGPGWIFSKRRESAVRALLESAATTGTLDAAKPAKSNKNALGEWFSTLKQDAETLSNHKKWDAAAVKLTEGFYVISKPRIENQFCFHDEGPEYDYYLSLGKEEKLRDHFLWANLRNYDSQLEILRNPTKNVYVNPTGVRQDGTATTCELYFEYPYWARTTPRTLTPEEKADAAEVLQEVRDAFEKRLHAYLKRYGTSKIRTWSYWADA